MMIFNHTSDNNVVIPYVLRDVKFDKKYILWNIRFLLLWSGEPTRYEYRGCKINIKVRFYVFLKLCSVCPSLCFSLVSDASDSVVGMMLSRVKDDDGTHSQIVRFSSTRARQLVFRLSHSLLLVIHEEGTSDTNDNPLPEYSSLMI